MDKEFIIDENTKSLVFVKDTEPAQVYLNGTLVEGMSAVKSSIDTDAQTLSYQSEYKKNLLELAIEGNTEQKQLQGKNIFDLSQNRYSGGSLINAKDETSITVSGNNTWQCVGIALPNDRELIGKTITVSGTILKSENAPTHAGLYVRWFDGHLGVGVNSKNIGVYGANAVGYVSKSGIVQDLDFETYPNARLCVAFYSNTDGTNDPNASITYRDVQVEFDNVATEKEEYCGGIPSPNPSYPQPIQNVGNDVFSSEYQQVEYIESTGTQIIDTKFKPTSNTKVELDLKFTNRKTTSNNSNILGTYDTENVFSLNFGSSADQANTLFIWVNARATNGGTNTQISVPNAIAERNTLTLTNSKFTYGTYSVDLKKGSWKSLTQSLRIFGYLNGSFREISFDRYNMVLYGGKIYDNDILVRDFIPCYNKRTNATGLYDRVTKQFYSNNGTGEFLKGEEINKFIQVELRGDFEPTTVQIPSYLASQDKLIVNYVDKSVKVNREYVKLNLADLTWNYGISSSTNVTFFYCYLPYTFTGTGYFNRGTLTNIPNAELNEMTNTIVIRTSKVGTQGQLEIAFSPDFDLKADGKNYGDVNKLIDWLEANPCEVLLKISSDLEETYTGETWASDLLGLPTQNATNIITVNSTIPTSKLSVDYAEWGGRNETQSL